MITPWIKAVETSSDRRRNARPVVALVVYFLIAPLPMQAQNAPAKNVIFMVPDGCSSEQYTLARWLRTAKAADGKKHRLAVDSIRVGAVETYIADSVIADSAPTGSAYATGHRTSDKFISVGPQAQTLPMEPRPPEAMQYRPMATVLEGARLLGKATGVVVTSGLSHATPASFLAHVPSRKQDEDIMEQAVHQGCDVLFGGGRRFLLPDTDQGGKRSDRADLSELLQTRGYKVLSQWPTAWDPNPGKVAAFLAPDALSPELDRQAVTPEQPSLREMTAKAIELLARDPDGFFLMVEGSQVDWACHANDPAYMATELSIFDEAVQVALDFAQRDGNTLLVVCSDHNTGGMTIGNMRSNTTYSQTSIDDVAAPLLAMSRTADAVWREAFSKLSRQQARDIHEGSGEAPKAESTLVQALRDTVASRWQIALTDNDVAEIMRLAIAYKQGAYALAETVSRSHTLIGWTSHGHTGGDVPLYAFGPGAPSGLLEGPQVGAALADALGLDMIKLNQRLFVPVHDEFPGNASEILAFDRNQDGRDDDWMVRITYNGRNAELPVNTNTLHLDGNANALEGVVVYAPNRNQAYIPMQAVQLIKRDGNTTLPSVVESPR